MDTEPRTIYSPSFNTVFECEICRKTFENQEVFKAHKKTEHIPKNTNECKICSKTFGNHVGLKDHEKAEHIPKTINQCKLCSKTFENLECLEVHKKTEHMDETQKESFQQSDFQFTPHNPFPPDQAQMIMQTLKMVIQKMDVMEKVFLQNIQ